MTTRRWYDLVVLGSSLPALLCGALVGKRGFRVLVLGQGEPDPTYEACGRELPRAPFTFLAAHSPAARRIFAELTVHQVFRRRAVAVDPALQLVMPRHRFDLSLEAPDLSREIVREFPKVRRPIEEFHQTVDRTADELDQLLSRDLGWPPESFFERREFARLSTHQPFGKRGDALDPLRDLADHHPFRHGMGCALRFAGDLDPAQLNPFARTRLYTAWRRGSAKLEGGERWLRETLVERIRTFGGDVRLGERADRIRLNRGIATGVRLERAGEEIGASFVACGDDLVELMRLLPNRASFAELFEKMGEPRLRWFRYTLNVVIDAEGVPEGMGHDVVFLRDSHVDPALRPESLLWVQTGDERDGERVITVSAMIPRRAVEEIPGYLDTMRERVLASLGELVPFLGQRIILVDSPHDGREIQRLRERSLIGHDKPWTRGAATMQRVYGFPVLGALGVCALPVRTPIRNVLLCNRQVVPGLGAEGQFITARSAARIVASSDRRRRWMKRGLFTNVDV